MVVIESVAESLVPEEMTQVGEHGIEIKTLFSPFVDPVNDERMTQM